MRLPLLLVLPGLLPLVSAYGRRAAAEKAAYYLTYIMEEAFDDPSQYTVAKDCPGSRAGGRCTLLEFCDYLWKDRSKVSGGGTYGDKQPDKSKVTMTEPSHDALSAESIYSAVMGARQGSDPLTSIDFGYIGAVDGDKLIGEPDWYKATAAMGDSMREAAKACKNAVDYEKWEDFPDKLEDASKLTIDMRLIDNAKIEMNEKNGLTKYTGGRFVDSIKYEPLSEAFASVWRNPVLVVDDESTIESWQSEETEGGKVFPALSEDEAKALLASSRDAFNAADGNLHKMAIEAGMEMERRRGLSCTGDSSDDSDSDSDSDSSGSDSD